MKPGDRLSPSPSSRLYSWVVQAVRVSDGAYLAQQWEQHHRWSQGRLPEKPTPTGEMRWYGRKP